jgi:hypothetical protein
MKTSTKSIISIALMILVASISPATAVTYPSPPKVVVLDCGTHATKPDTLTIYCADAGVNVNHIKWTKWAQSGAIGTGQYSANNCTPNCVSGKVISAQVKVSLAGSKLVKSEYVMSALTITSTSGRALPLLRKSMTIWILE